MFALVLAITLTSSGIFGTTVTKVEAAEGYPDQPYIAGGASAYGFEFAWTLGKEIPQDSAKEHTMFIVCTNGRGVGIEHDFERIQINDWFNGSLPAGVDAYLAAMNTMEALKATGIRIHFEGTPTEVASKNISLSIPAGYLTNWKGGTTVKTMVAKTTGQPEVPATITVTDTEEGAGATTFITNYLTVDGAAITAVTLDNYQKVLDAGSAYDALSEGVKAEVNKRLSAAGGTSYPELLTAANDMVNVVEAITDAKTKFKEYATRKKSEISNLPNIFPDNKFYFAEYPDIFCLQLANALTKAADIKTVPDVNAVVLRYKNGLDKLVERAEATDAIDGDVTAKISRIEALSLTREVKDAATANIQALAVQPREDIKTTSGDMAAIVTAFEASTSAVVDAYTWKDTHKDILAVDEGTVTEDHLPAITNALYDYEKLSDEAKALMTTEKEKLDGMKIKAENDQNDSKTATDWLDKYNDLLEKQPKDLTKQDVTDITNALSEIEGYSEGAKEKLAEQKKKLEDKIKAYNLIQEKEKAKADIDEDAASEIAKIDTLTDLTEKQKADAKKAITDKAAAAKEKVEAITDPEKTTDVQGVVEESKAATKAIVDEATLLDAKNELKKEIEDVAEKKIAMIKALSDLSEEEKQTYIAEVKSVTEATNTLIDEEESDANFATIRSEYTKDKVNPIYTKALFLNKQNFAKNKLREAADEKIEAMKTMDLSEKEKEDLKTLINQSVRDASTAIENDTALGDVINECKNELAYLTTQENEAIAKAFTNTYLREKAGTALYQKVESTNIDQIISGSEDFDALTDEQKALVNQIIAEESDFETYEDYLTKAESYVTETASKFIAEHLTKEDKSTVKSATHDTYEMILGGADDWSKLSEAEKAAIEASLKDLGATETYENMLKNAMKGTSSNASQFMQKYLTKDNKNYYSSATKENYKQILSGEEAWNKLNPSEQAKINESLKALGINKDYETLLKEAKAMKAKVDAEEKAKAEADAKKKAEEKVKADAKEKVSTGDTASLALWMSLLGISGGALFVADRRRRKRN